MADAQDLRHAGLTEASGFAKCSPRYRRREAASCTCLAEDLLKLVMLHEAKISQGYGTALAFHP